LIIPSSALVFQEAGTEVAVLTNDDTVHFRKIRLGRIMDGYIEVKEGVTRADRIVQTPSAALLEGDKVRVVAPARGYEDKTALPAPPPDREKKGEAKPEANTDSE
jgi:multidrug efflux pump subunit AcrA (membrane-fusion protein)